METVRALTRATLEGRLAWEAGTWPNGLPVHEVHIGQATVRIRVTSQNTEGNSLRMLMKTDECIALELDSGKDTREEMNRLSEATRKEPQTPGATPQVHL